MPVMIISLSALAPTRSLRYDMTGLTGPLQKQTASLRANQHAVHPLDMAHSDLP